MSAKGIRMFLEPLHTKLSDLILIKDKKTLNLKIFILLI